MSRNFEYNAAVRKGSPLILGIFGPSGGGKTWSSLRLATGIQRVVGNDIAVIDTEAGRALKYSEFFKFKHVPFAPPFRSLDYLAAAEHCAKMGAKTIVVDSMTHEHAGIGGYLEFAEAELDRMAGDNYGKRQACKLASFIKPGCERRKMIDGFLAMGTNFIFTFRAKEKVKPEKVKRDGDREKTEIVNLGFMPIGSTELVFEMDAACLLLPHAGGIPTWQSDEVGEKMMIKTAEQFTRIFADRQPLSEDIGQALAEWAQGPAGPDPEIADLEARGEKAAKEGLPEYEKFFKSLTIPQKKKIQHKHDGWKKIAFDVPTKTP
jgi:hypothetical protein